MQYRCMLIRKLGRNMTTNEEELLKKRPLTNSTALLEMTPHANETATPILQEAYKKHATELANIEDRQHKLTLLMLGIFSAGATLMASGHIDLSCKSKWALTILSLAIVEPQSNNVEFRHGRDYCKLLRTSELRSDGQAGCLSHNSAADGGGSLG